MRKPNWKRRGITREQAIRQARNVDFAHAQIERRGSVRKDDYDLMKQHGANYVEAKAADIFNQFNKD